MNASVPLIKLSSTEGTVLFFTVYFSEKSYVELLIGKKITCFSLLIMFYFTVFAQSDRLIHFFAKSTLYLHRGTFARGTLCEGVHKSVLSLDTADE